MSSPASDKQSKGKSRKAHSSKSSKSTKGAKEGDVIVDKFRGDGVNFKCKLLGVAEVDGPRGDSMCVEAIKKLKAHQRQSGEHKMKIILNVSLMGIRILEEKTKNIMFEHPVNKVSFITHDPEDKKIFSFISSAKCSAGSVGHMMYAIKYDKVAGIITSTLYDLFQAVFKLRQEAALKQRKAQQGPQPLPQNSHVPANNATLSNGPSETINMEDTNIYEEPSSTVTKQEDETHYKVPTPRPLPPAPYSSASSQGKTIENSGDSISNQDHGATSENFFSTTVFSSTDHQDNVSESSVDVTRKGSISSSISSTSETASFDSRSLELKSGAASTTPPAAPRARTAAPSTPSGQALGSHPPTVHASVGQAPASSEIKSTTQDEDPDYETIESTDYETIPSDLLTKTEKTNTKVNFGEFSFKESFGEDESFPFEAEKKSNNEVNPFGSEPSLKKSEGSPPSSAVFGNDDDFFSSNFDDKTASAPITDFPVDDPFAPTLSTAAQESQTTDAFASSDAFESAFGGDKMSPFDPKENTEKTKEDINNHTNHNPLDSSIAFDSSFSTTAMSSRESKPTEDISIKQDSSNGTKKDLSWSNAFGDDNKKELGDNDKKADSSWSTVFEDSEPNKKDDEPTKTDKKEVSFSFDDSFGAKFDVEEQDRNQKPDDTAAEPDFSWTNAFKDQSQKEVTFSWDDAFGGHVDSKNGDLDSKDGQTDNINEDAFTDAFSSTPFKPPQPKNDSGVKSNGTFTVANFDDILSPMKPNPPTNETDENTNNKTNDVFSASNFSNSNTLQSDKSTNVKEKNELGMNISSNFPMADFGDILSPEKANDGEIKAKEETKEEESAINEEEIESEQSSEPGINVAKPKLADIEDLESDTTVDQENTELAKEPNKGVCSSIPQIIEPHKEDARDAEGEPFRPVTLPILPSKTTGGKESPTAPPPLPPRPTMAPLPSLPPRPRTQSSPLVGQIPPTPPRAVGSTGTPTAKTGTPKRAPPAPPPRIDLEGGKVEAHSTSAKNAIADPFIFSENSWQADWTSSTSQNIKKENDSNSKKSDPFGDAFFTDFNSITVSESDEHKIDSGNHNNADLFSDPFATKAGSEDIFKTDFGGVDPFADFTTNKSTVDPFASDGKDVFSGFSTTDDPFLDSVDPFADKGSLNNDPFAVSPKRDGKEGKMALNLTKNSDDGDFADSFA